MNMVPLVLLILLMLLVVLVALVTKLDQMVDGAGWSWSPALPPLSPLMELDTGDHSPLTITVTQHSKEGQIDHATEFEAHTEKS